MKIKTKIKKWLGIDIMDSNMDNLHHRIETLEGLLLVSVDYSPHGRDISWAVISVKGKSEWVQFFDLGRADIREISHFLKQYQRGNTAIDAIMGMPKDIFFSY